MVVTEINKSLEKKILNYAENHPYENNTQLAVAFSIGEASIRRLFARVTDPRQPQVSALAIDLDKPIHTPLDDGLMITADWHIPLYSADWVNHMLDTAQKNKIRRLAVVGDWNNFDSLSQYDPKQVTAGLELELSEGRKLSQIIDQVFDEIIFTSDNHGVRLVKSWGYKIAFSEAMKAVLPNIHNFRFTNLDHFWIDTPTPWYVCHPKSYSSVPLTSGLKLSDKYNANVVTAHSHHLAAGFAKDGKRKVVECGGLFNRDQTAYLQSSTTFSTWTNGFCYLTEDSKMHVIGDNMEVTL